MLSVYVIFTVSQILCLTMFLSAWFSSTSSQKWNRGTYTHGWTLAAGCNNIINNFHYIIYASKGSECCSHEGFDLYIFLVLNSAQFPCLRRTKLLPQRMSEVNFVKNVLSTVCCSLLQYTAHLLWWHYRMLVTPACCCYVLMWWADFQLGRCSVICSAASH